MYSIESFDKQSPLIEDFSNVLERLYGRRSVKGDVTGSLSDIDSHRFFVGFEDGRPIGRIAALYNPNIVEGEKKAGLVGYYECIDSVDASNRLLDAATAYLRTLDCDCCLGPMNGNTWQNYRLTLPDKSPPFFLDNHHKPYYHRLFRAYGFKEAARYTSARIPRDRFSFDRIGIFADRMAMNGVSVRQFESGKFTNELKHIHTICLKSFTENLYYTPIGWEEFKSLYINVKPVMNEQFVLLAMGSKGEPLGFVFALPNLLSSQTRSLVIKSVAVVPEIRAQGLGSYMIELVHKAAHDMGFDEIIHAMMHSGNISNRIGAAGSETFRNYVLMRMDL